ncbi:patatin-like phospholipase family protein [Chromobacterium vaccinii]|uniref:patatin-like phospholipase family protein n=1 Tax=Chromobacterium vaccinii TaxID=1108595 RepID=UPI000E15507E|nr:patatin-like phospholipase family protein [Chromobacterium vaccinii]SUX54805.1 Patatin-like phospholipase [Chromobacterium vaccinii]
MAQFKRPSIALVLGGGAPNATLMAGALVALTEAGVKFDIISASGAGAIVGLLYAAPRQGDALAALSRLADMGVSDRIYSLFPVNYKVFNKPGPLADAWRSLLSNNPFCRRYSSRPTAARPTACSPTGPRSRWPRCAPAASPQIARACARTCPSSIRWWISPSCSRCRASST